MNNKKFQELKPEELKRLYLAFVDYRDSVCDGWAKMGIKEFYFNVYLK